MRPDTDTFWRIAGAGWFFALDGIDHGPFANRLAAEIERFRILLDA